VYQSNDSNHDPGQDLFSFGASRFDANYSNRRTA